LIALKHFLPGVASLLLTAFAAQAAPETVIWFDTPATNFTASCPLGNGRLGAMMFGGIDHERVVLNESSVWSGSPQDSDRPDAYKVLPEIRRLLLAGKNTEAEALVNANFTCQGPGSAGPQWGCYQVLGNLHLDFQYSHPAASVANYRRELDLDTATAHVQFDRGGVGYSREIFSTAPDQVIVYHLTANQPGELTFALSLNRPERFATIADSDHSLLMTGQLDNGAGGGGVKYAARVSVSHRAGLLQKAGETLQLTGADEATILISAATDYRGFAGRQLSDPVAASAQDLQRAAHKSYTTLRSAHIADFQKYFERVHLDLDSAPDSKSLPTPARVEAFHCGADDPGLAALYFNFGRYLLISSSRPGGLPANLQGIWAEEIHTPWNSDWHLDINVQMNYWPAEVCNLSELTQPLFALIASLQAPGARTARAYYNARGWVAHVIANPWGFTSPGEGASWGATTGGSAWLCQHLWDHWLFTGDTNFLRWAYPIMQGSARFYDDMLIPEPTHHWLVIAPANSPENHFRMADGKEASIALGTTVHSQMIDYLFNACIQSSKILGIDDDFRRELTDKRARLAPTQIGHDGRIMEWLQEYGEPEIHHRHVSHLWALYPGDQISPETTPALADAARQSLIVRGDEGTGWSRVNKALLWARLNDGNHAWKLLCNALDPVLSQEIRYDNGGGVYPNLFDSCPPFQIDGNFGATAAIAEMLLHSQEGEIELLPALPDAWKNGRVTGLRARGGFAVDIAWQNGRLTRAAIRSQRGARCHIRYAGRAAEFSLPAGQSLSLNDQLQAQ